MNYTEAVQLLYQTWLMDSGASPGAYRILKACQFGSGEIDIDDLFRLDRNRREAALIVIQTTLATGTWQLGTALSASQVKRIEDEAERIRVAKMEGRHAR